MATTRKTAAPRQRSAARPASVAVSSRQSSATVSPATEDYELPLIHTKVPEQLGNAAFWLGLAGAVALGAVEPPLAALVGAGVVVARHRSSK